MPQKKKGYKTAAYRMHPDQIEALREEAWRRATVRKPRPGHKADASELVREAVDGWLESHVKGYKRPKP